MTQPVALFYMNRAPGGGSTSYAVHLYRGLQLAGYAPRLMRITERGEGRVRQLAKYEGVEYQNVTAGEAFNAVGSMPSLLVAACHSKELPFAPTVLCDLIDRGMRAVVHDPNEFKIYDHLDAVRRARHRPIAIRPTMLEYFPTAVVIPHPYVREYAATKAGTASWMADWKARPWHAVSVARVTFVKRTHLLLDANRLLPPAQQIVLRGAENRLYTRHKLREQYPEFRQGSTGFKLEWGASARECLQARLAVDMTYFPGDGGGSQYSFMEAWDAGTVNVVATDWLRYSGEMRADSKRGNCLIAGTGAEIAEVLRLADPDRLAPVAQAGYDALRKHDAATVARAIYEEIAR